MLILTWMRFKISPLVNLVSRLMRLKISPLVNLVAQS